LGVLFSSAVALGQVATEHAQAEALSDAAAVSRAAGDTEEECSRLEASARFEPTPARVSVLAECNERLGRSATAWATYGRAAVLARRGGSVEEQARAEAEVARLEPSLVKLSVVVPEPHQLIGLEVFHDGVLLDRSLYGVGVAVDPGPHKLVARAPHHVSWSTEIGMPAAPGTVSVRVPMLSWSAIPSIARPSAVPRRSSAPSVSPVLDDPGSTQRTIAWVVSGSGAALLGAGLVATLVANGHEKDLERRCSRTDACSSDARDDFEALQASRAAALLLFGTGGVAMVSGVAVYALSPRGTSTTSALGVAPVVAPGTAGLLATGRF
jgi:hypothetical protein